MNASALLTSQGWLGPGHALDSRLTDYGAQTYKQKGHRGLAYDPNQKTSSSQPISSGNGLIRPLLISQRHGSKHGIGKKSHEPASGNEWWLKGFASALANVGKSESERSSSAPQSGTSTPRNGFNHGYTGKHSGLYNYFTAGQVMKGTLSQSEEQDPENGNTNGNTGPKRPKKRKSDVLEESDQTKNRDPLAVAPVKRVQSAQEYEKSIPYLLERDRERKAAHQRMKSNELESFAAIGQFMEVMEGKDGKKQSKKSQQECEPANVSGETSADQHQRQKRREDETKEERRARRRRRKEAEAEAEAEKRDGTRSRKKGALSLAQMVEEELLKLSSVDNSDEEGSTSRSNHDRIAVPVSKAGRGREKGTKKP